MKDAVLAVGAVFGLVFQVVGIVVVFRWLFRRKSQNVDDTKRED